MGVKSEDEFLDTLQQQQCPGTNTEQNLDSVQQPQQQHPNTTYTEQALDHGGNGNNEIIKQSMSSSVFFTRSTKQITKFEANLLQILKVLNVSDIPKPLSTSAPVPTTKNSKLIELAKTLLVSVNNAIEERQKKIQLNINKWVEDKEHLGEFYIEDVRTTMTTPPQALQQQQQQTSTQEVSGRSEGTNANQIIHQSPGRPVKVTKKQAELLRHQLLIQAKEEKQKAAEKAFRSWLRRASKNKYYSPKAQKVITRPRTASQSMPKNRPEWENLIENFDPSNPGHENTTQKKKFKVKLKGGNKKEKITGQGGPTK